jgi:hypothetical protein
MISGKFMVKKATATSSTVYSSKIKIAFRFSIISQLRQQSLEERYLVFPFCGK